MRNRLHYFILAGLGLAAASCGYEELPTQVFVKPPAVTAKAQAPAEAAKKDIQHYTYKGDKFRDPFIPLTGEGYAAASISEEVTVPNIGSLALKGIFDDGKVKMALISGGGINYILKGSRLFDNRQRLVRGITGIIKKESVLMIAPDKTTKELKLKTK